MHASKLFTAIAALAFAGAAFANDTPAAAAATAPAAAAAQVAVAAKAAAVATPGDKRSTAEKTRAEAVEANYNRRATEASQFDWFMK